MALVARDETGVKEAAARLGGESLTLSVDVPDNDSVVAAVNSAHEWRGRPDIVVNCAGPQISSAPIADTEDAAVSSALDAKLRGFVRVAKAALPKITNDGGGAIVNIAGATAHMLVAGAVRTGMANAAVVALTSYVASEAAARNVRVNAVSPA